MNTKTARALALAALIALAPCAAQAEANGPPIRTGQRPSDESASVLWSLTRELARTPRLILRRSGQARGVVRGFAKETRARARRARLATRDLFRFFKHGARDLKRGLKSALRTWRTARQIRKARGR